MVDFPDDDWTHPVDHTKSAPVVDSKKVDPASVVEALPKAYPQLAKADYFVVVGVNGGRMAFRYGPFTNADAAEIYAQCENEGIKALLVVNCGTPFDWEVPRDLFPLEYHLDAAHTRLRNIEAQDAVRKAGDDLDRAAGYGDNEGSGG